MADDPLAAALDEVRVLVAARDALVRRMATGEAVGVPVFNAAQDRLAERVPALLAAVDAALASHEPYPLYGNAATEDEPGCCPHDPDADCHFEGDDGDWLCRCRPEGAVCTSCTEDGLPVAWQCHEYAAILAAILREDPVLGEPATAAAEGGNDAS